MTTTDGQFKNEKKKMNAPHFIPMDDGTSLTEIRKDVFLDRYSLKDVDGSSMETYPEQMWKRVAWGIAQEEKTEKLQKEWEDKFYEAMEDFKFVPAGRILTGAGSGYEVTFYNCYVIPSPKDSRHGIMDNISLTVEIQARGGGVGLNLSSLRPRGARVKKVNGTSSGPVNWASLYSTANHDVIQQGGSRRGALMLMINDWHPDVEEFITVKQDLSKIPGANLSVCVSDAFMKAVKEDSDWDLVFPDLDDPNYDEKWNGDLDEWKAEGHEVKVYKTVKARSIWDMVADAAWRSAEPGVVFIDRYNELSNSWYFEKIIATNPCGEQGLGAWGVCNLGHVNLSPFVKEGKMDYDDLKKHVAIATRFLDNVIEANFYFAPENEKVQRFGVRRTGLGTLGLADALIKMGIRYGSDESLKVIEKIYRLIRDTAYETSSDLALEKGSFPKFDKEKYLKGKFIQRLPEEIKTKISKQGIRNGILLTQAPTGTISLLAGTSSGIEPVYEFTYKRNDRTGEHIVHHPLYQDWLDKNPGKEVPDYFVSASGLTPEEHVRVQAAVQKFVDASISKTVNAPNSHSVDDVKRLYNLAYELGCKGVTYFRDGSRAGVLAKVEEKKVEAEVAPVAKKAWERPIILTGSTYKIKTPVGTAFITVNHDQLGNPIEVFINIGKAGSDLAAMAEALGRLTSKFLKLEGNVSAREKAQVIMDQLRGIGGRGSVGFGPNKVRSLPDAVALALATHFGIGTPSNGAGAVMAAAISSNEEKPVKVLYDPTTASAPLEVAPMTNGHSNGLSNGVHLTNGHSNGVSHLSITSLETSEIATSQIISDELPTDKVADICPSCGANAFVYEEGCSKCYACGHSEC